MPVGDSYDGPLDLLESIERFLKYLNIYTRAPSTPATEEIIIKIMVELLSTLALATKELKQGRSSESVLDDVLRHSVQYSRKKTFWRTRRRAGLTKARSPHPRRGWGDGGGLGDSQGYLRSHPGYE